MTQTRAITLNALSLYAVALVLVRLRSRAETTT